MRRVTFIINLKAKTKELERVKTLLNEAIAPLKRDGFYFKFNYSEIATKSIVLASQCSKSGKVYEPEEA